MWVWVWVCVGVCVCGCVYVVWVCVGVWVAWVGGWVYVACVCVCVCVCVHLPCIVPSLKAVAAHRIFLFSPFSHSHSPYHAILPPPSFPITHISPQPALSCSEPEFATLGLPFPVATWTTADVCQWLRQLNPQLHNSYTPAFCKCHMTGELCSGRGHLQRTSLLTVHT